MTIEKYSIGIGDRFGHQGTAQLAAFVKAKERGVNIVPVWNKSNREHALIGTKPADVRKEADRAVRALGWNDSYYVDADHIGINTVDLFVEPSNYFTLDVADFIGKEPCRDDLEKFQSECGKYVGNLRVTGLKENIAITKEMITAVGTKYLSAVKEAGKIYRHIVSRKGKDNFITEVSTDESNDPQTPADLFLILAALAQEGVMLQTIATKFTGEFLKGVDYVGDIKQFAKEFEQDIAIIAFAVKEFSLPESLKISVHSGSDKFSIYPIINRTIKKFDAGLHLKTAGTTWLEEVIGLARFGGTGLQIAKEVYTQSYQRFDELAKPYLTVIDIDVKKLPNPSTVKGWNSQDFVRALKHDQSCLQYNNSFRQLVHIGYKIAAEMGERFMAALDESQKDISAGVTENIFQRHLVPLFLNND